MKRALFLDRDGTIIEDRGYIRDPADVVLLPGAAEALRALEAAGWTLIVVSNQSGVGRGFVAPAEMDAVQVRFAEVMRAAGVVELQVQDWATRTPSRPTTRPSGTVEIQPAQLTWRQKMQIVGRAWRGRGWREARTAVARETELIRELSRERTIGFQLITGVKWPHPVTV